MSYQLNKTDGTILTDLIDGQIDTESTNLTLVGKNYTGYGEAFNENFIKLLENFANTAAPSNPLEGQLWWNSSEQRLKVYDGTVWKASGGPYVQETRPQMVAGDLWIDNLNNQVYAYDGTDTILIGPLYTQSQGISGFQIANILDTQSRSRTVAKFFIGGVLVGIFSNIEFTPTYSQRITSLVTENNPNGIIYEGFNIINSSTFKFYGIAQSSNALVTASGEIRTADQFLPSDSDGITVGTLTIQNSGGLTIGPSQNNVQKVIGPRFYIENQLRDHDISLRVRSSAFESIIVDAIYVDASTAKVGIFTTNRLPEYTLDVEGDLRVTGNLIVQGDTTTIEVSTLKVEDKNIELAALNDSSLGNDTVIDGAGIIVRSSDGNKTITWELLTDSWTFNKNIDLSDNTLSLSIGGSTKLTTDSLSNILYADDLVRIGTLQFLDVDNININSNTITSSLNLVITAASGINITAGGDIAIQDSQKITGLADPTAAQDAATKAYVDLATVTAPVVFSLDITGLGSGLTLQTNVATYLNDLFPSTVNNSGKLARIHTTSYTGSTVSGIVVSITETPDTSGVLSLSRVAVDSNGTQNESVIQDIVSSNTASGVAVLTPVRSLMVFESTGLGWSHVSTTAYP
jgi:hypothetical protein